MPRRRDRMLALGGLLPAAGVLYGVVARPRINQWGATDQEHRATWPGDRLLARPDYVWTNAITIQRPAEQVQAVADDRRDHTQRQQQRTNLGVTRRASTLASIAISVSPSTRRTAW